MGPKAEMYSVRKLYSLNNNACYLQIKSMKRIKNENLPYEFVQKTLLQNLL